MGAQKATGEYAQQPLNTIKVYKHRAAYDYHSVHSVFASTFVTHVSFITEDEDGEPTPMNLPMTAVLGRYNPEDPLPEDDGTVNDYYRQQLDVDKPMDVYLHGNSAMMLRRAVKPNGKVKVCLTSTKVDGVVLNFTPNGHSLNYRSAVIHGYAELVESPAEKRYSMHLLTNHMVPRRWSNTNEVTPSVLKSVQILRVTVKAASAKVRAKNMGAADSLQAMVGRDDVYTGVVPLHEVLGSPMESGYNGGKPVQHHLKDWIEQRNEAECQYAHSATKESAEDTQSIAKHLEQLKLRENYTF